jgi:hypothetical protein
MERSGTSVKNGPEGIILAALDLILQASFCCVAISEPIT